MITSLANPLVARVRRLQEKARYRQKEQAFFAEGVPIVSMAIANRASIETLIYSDELLIDAEGRVALGRQQAEGVCCVAVSEKVFRAISQRNNPDGLAAVCRTMWRDLGDLAVRPSDVFVAAESVSDPGNLGTILRTMDATGAAGLILCGQSANPFHPRTVRASRGTLFTVPMCHVADMETVFKWAHTHDVQSIATSAHGERPFWGATYPLPVLCIFGNENRGLDAATMDAADQLVTIPMAGAASSLNISVAVSLVLYELTRIRCNGP